MKKKTRGTAPGAPKRRKSGVVEPKGSPQRARRVKVPPASAPRPSVTPNGAKLTIRRLKVQLAQARARIEELEASADTDFLLDIPNRRGFERELNRAVAYIKRYHASAALIVLDVDRLKPIHDQTQATNKKYRAALKGTVWKNYQLVATQWPLKPNDPTLPGTPQNTFPGTIGATTAFANITMESFDQKSVALSCMACHDATKGATDFLWSLNDHAFPADSGAPNLIMKNPAVRKLRDTLKAAAEK